MRVAWVENNAGEVLEVLGEYTHLALALPAVVVRLGWRIIGRRIAPPQTISIEEDYAARYAAIVNPWLARAL